MPIKKAEPKRGLITKGLERAQAPSPFNSSNVLAPRHGRGLRTGGLRDAPRPLRQQGGGGGGGAFGGGAQVGVHQGVVNVRQPVQWEGEPIFWAPPQLHQFQCYRKDTNIIGVNGGFVYLLKGLDTDNDGLVSEPNSLVESGSVTVTGAGAVWLQCTATITQHSASSAGSGVDLVMHRIDSITTPTFAFLTSAPAVGTDATARWIGSAVDVNIRIADVELVAGKAVVKDQYIQGHITLTDLVDGELS